MEELLKQIGLEKAKKNAKSTTIHDRLMNTFGKTISDREYPNYYGGAYIDEDDNYVINVVEDGSDWKDDLELRIDLTDVRINFVQYSYDYLRKLRDKSAKLVNESEGDLHDSIVGWGISNKTNKINVYSSDIGEKIRDELRNLFDGKDIFQLINIGKVEEESTSIYSGSVLQEGSTAYRAKYGTTVGIIVAAHMVQYLNYVHLPNGTSIAKCTYRQYSGPADAAFCEINDTSLYTPSNTIDGIGTVLSTVLSNPSEGSLIYKRGCGSTSYGYITEDDFSYNDVDVFDIYTTHYYTNLTLASYSSTNGDSGGLIFRIGVDSTIYTVGVHRGKVTVLEDDGNYHIRAVYTKASNVRDTLNVTRY